MSRSRRVSRSASLRLGVAMAVGGALIAACGGSPTSAPGAGAANLPPQTNPGVADKDKDKSAREKEGPRKTIKGTVIDALTGEPVEKAQFVIEGVQTTISSTPIPAGAPPTSDEPPNDDAPPGSKPISGKELMSRLAAMEAPAPYILAQATTPPTDNPPLPDAETTTGPSPGMSTNPAASPGVSPGVSPAPRESVATSPAPSAVASGVAAASASPSPGASGSPTPVPAGTPYPATALKVDSRGRFELKDLPDGSYNLTFFANGYQATTIQGSLPDEVEVVLRPIDIDNKNLHEMKGVVRQANNQPAPDVDVEVSSVVGKLPGVRETSDINGNFTMKGLYAGNYAAAAWTTNLEGEVTTFAMVKEVPVSLGRERRTVSPTLVLHAVTTPVLLAGTVEGSAKEAEVKAAIAAKKPIPGIRPVSMRAFIQVGDGEIPIATVPVGKDGYFRMKLPQLPEGASYHLVAGGQSESGQTSYVHEYEIEASDPKLVYKLPEAPEPATVLDRTKHPRFSWEPVSADVSAYRLAIDKIGQEGDTIWEAWTTGTAVGLPNIKELSLLRDGESYRYSLTAVKLADDKKVELIAMANRPWASSGITKPATFEVVKLKPGQKPPAEPTKPVAKPKAIEAVEEDAPVTGTSPAAKASAKPAPKASAKPTPKPNPRTKPMDDL